MTHVDLDALAALAFDPDDGTESTRRHVESCRECADLLASLVDVRRLAGEEPLVPAPAQVREQVLAQVHAPPAGDLDHPVAQPPT